MIDLEKSIKAFDEFTGKYDINNKKIKLKYDHTFRVCYQSRCISDSIGSSSEDKDLAYLIALLHDIGRFEQIRMYNTFSDLDSVDHADLGCKILFEQGLIRNFISDTSYDEIIEFAIRNHNKFLIESTTDDKKLLQAKIVRDADKIDIMNLTLVLDGIKINEDENGISRKVSEDFFKEKSINHKDKNTKNDSVLTMISFIYDLNFDYSYVQFKDMNYINLFNNHIKNKELFKMYIEYANNYIERKCSNAKCKIYSQRSRK